MDCTGSMGAWIDASCKKVNEIVDQVLKKYPGLPIRMAFVAYRDFCDGAKQFEVKQFTDDIDSLRTFIHGIKAGGGGDTSEDVLGGLLQCINLEWKHTVRLVIHFADSPSHGSLYHTSDVDDHHVGIDVDGSIGKGLMKQLVEKRIDYYFAEITARTKQMTNQFKVWYDAEPHKHVPMIILEVGSDASKFVNVVTTAVYKSMGTKT